MIRYITQPAAGSASGDSWANGASITSLPTLFAASDPGDEIHLEGGRTFVHNGMTLTSTRLAGATEATRVAIRGVNPADGVPATARVEGSLRPEVWVPGANTGGRMLKLEAGVRFVRFAHLSFRRHSECIAFRHADNTGFLVEDVDAYNVTTVLNHAGSLCPAVTASIFRRITSRLHTGNFAGFSGDSNGLLFEDIDDDAQYADDGVPGKGSNGISLGGTAHGITHRRCNMRNGGREEGTNYWNGDGFVTSDFNYDLTYDRCQASGWLDAGWDMKSSRTLIRDCTSSDNKRNWRFHSAPDYILERCRSLFPRKRGGSGSQDHMQLEHNAGQPWPSTEVHTHGMLLEDDDPATSVSVHTGGPTLLVIEGRSRILRNAASALSSHAERTVLSSDTTNEIFT